MINQARLRKTIGWVLGGIALVSAFVLVWVGYVRPAKIREQNLNAVVQVLFTRPDPMMVLMGELDWESYKIVYDVIGYDLNYLRQVAPYFTERGKEYAFKINSGLDLSCANSGMVSSVQSVTLGEKDEQGYNHFTVVVPYGVPGEESEIYTFEGLVSFDKQGLLDYFYVSHYQTSEFTMKTRVYYR